MWDGSAHLNIDRKKNMEIRTGTESTWKWRERQKLHSRRDRAGGKKKPFTLHVSPNAQTALSNTRKMNYYLEEKGGKRWGKEGNSVVK